MKTYLFQSVLTAVFPNKGQLKRVVACSLTSGISLTLLANTATYHISYSDTNRVVTNGTDQNTIKLPVNGNSQIAGAVGEEFSLPLVMTAFKVVLNNNKVSITWTTGFEKRLSHFVIEKSMNGIEFKESATVYAVTNSSVKQNYTYQESINIHDAGLLYYRIKLVDPVGKFQNSAVKLIRIGDEASVMEVTTYPNPVVNELRITIPSKWQNQQVRYEVFNSTGKLLKRITSSSANQTEIVNMQDCIAGMYVVRTSTGTETKTQSIIKK